MTDDRRALVHAEGLSKAYRIYSRPQDRLKQLVFGRLRRYYTDFWALHPMSLDVRAGEMLGIVGRNGSGKSTLLQIIAGTLQPTAGAVQVHGRMAALLELGAGFDPEFTGRENVFLSGAILGMTRDEVASRLEAITRFAEIGDRIDQPVRTFSSGMFVRLAFAVQVSLDPDVLIVDEALAVGDVFFRQKCYARIRELRDRGTAVVLVSHSMGDIEQHCDRALLMHEGHLVYEGSPAETIKNYYMYEQTGRVIESVARGRATGADAEPPPERPAESVQEFPADADFPIASLPQINTDKAVCTRVALCNAAGVAQRVFRWGETVTFLHEYRVLKDLDVPIAGFVIHSESGVIVHGRNSLQAGAEAIRCPAGVVLRCCQRVELRLAPGEYTFEVGLAELSAADYAAREAMSRERFESARLRLVQLPGAGHFTVIPAGSDAVRGVPHHGLVDLPGECVLDAYAPQPALSK